MNKNITRRDFLKLAGTLPVSVAVPRWMDSLDSLPKRPNIVVIVFDALSANNLSFYGYQRETMPNLSKLLEKAIVYHNHYAGGNFTTPGTASLLTGVSPWFQGPLTYMGSLTNLSKIKIFFRPLMATIGFLTPIIL